MTNPFYLSRPFPSTTNGCLFIFQLSQLELCLSSLGFAYNTELFPTGSLHEVREDIMIPSFFIMLVTRDESVIQYLPYLHVFARVKLDPLPDWTISRGNLSLSGGSSVLYLTSILFHEYTCCLARNYLGIPKIGDHCNKSVEIRPMMESSFSISFR